MSSVRKCCQYAERIFMKANGNQKTKPDSNPRTIKSSAPANTNLVNNLCPS